MEGWDLCCDCPWEHLAFYDHAAQTPDPGASADTLVSPRKEGKPVCGWLASRWRLPVLWAGIPGKSDLGKLLVLFSSGPHRIIRTSSSLTPDPTNSQLRMAQNPSLDNQAFLTGLEPGPDLPMGYCEQTGVQGGGGSQTRGPWNHLSGPPLTTCPLPSPEVPVCGSPRQSLRPHEPSPPCGRYHQLLLTEQGQDPSPAVALGY